MKKKLMYIIKGVPHKTNGELLLFLNQQMVKL